MTGLTRLQGIGVLLSALLVVGLLIGGAYLLRPAPGPLLAEVPNRPSGTCQDAAVRPEPIDVRSTTLLSCPALFDGRVVRVQGEPIGDLLGRGAGRWVQLNDDDYAFAGPLMTHRQTLGTNAGIAVLLDESMMSTVVGGPGVWGDLLEITGTFYTSAAEDQGGPAVIATAAEVLRQGRTVQPTTATAQRIVAPVMALLAAGLATTAWRRQQ